MSWADLVEQHIARREPEMAGKPKWRQYKYELRHFAKAMSRICSPDQAKLKDFLTFWDSLSRHKQDNLHPEWSKFLKWAILIEAVDLKTIPTDLLYKKNKPAKKRSRLNKHTFDQVLTRSLQEGLFPLYVASRLSYATSLRRGDIVNLKWSDISDGKLRVTVSKSKAMRGDVKAARLQWNLAEHQELAKLLEDAKKVTNSDYVIGGMSADWVSRKFAKMVRAVLGKTDESNPTFHEIRALSAATLEQSGISRDDIKKVMAHTDVSTTAIYLEGHRDDFVEIKISAKLQ